MIFAFKLVTFLSHLVTLNKFSVFHVLFSDFCVHAEHFFIQSSKFNVKLGELGQEEIIFWEEKIQWRSKKDIDETAVHRRKKPG